MILACHQPQYLPWLGFYHKLARSDVFVYLDDVQYKRREFQNRNRIKTPEGACWLTIPVLGKGRFGQKIRHVEVDAERDWAAEHFKSLLLHYGRAPHFAEHLGFLRGFYARNWLRLADACLEMDGYLRRQFGISARVCLESELGSEGAATARIISLCRKLNADSYLSGPSGKRYLDERAFEEAGIRLIYQEFEHPAYPQRFGPFVPNLAGLDLLFNCGPRFARELLRRDERRFVLKT